MLSPLLTQAHPGAPQPPPVEQNPMDLFGRGHSEGMRSKADNAESPEARVRDEVIAFKLLKEALEGDPDLWGDDEFVLHLAEGETQLFETLDRLLAQDLDDEVRIAGVRLARRELEARGARLEKRRGRRRAVIEIALLALNRRRLERPLATLSLVERPARLHVEDEAAIPARFFKLKPLLDKAALRAELDLGEPLPGAALVPGDVTLTVRRR